MPAEYVLDGRKITSLEAFYEEVDQALDLGSGWGRNLDAFNDILRGGFGTPQEGFTIRWTNSETSRRHLGYAETVRELEKGLGRGHPANRAAATHRLNAARAGRGPTVFDWVTEIIKEHGAGGREAEDKVELILM